MVDRILETRGRVSGWRRIAEQAVTPADKMEINPDSARGEIGYIEPFPRFPRTGSLFFSARLQASKMI